MRVVIVLLAVMFAGCVAEEAPLVVAPSPPDLTMYVLWLEEGGAQSAQASADFLAVVTNHGDANATYGFHPGVLDGHFGMFTVTGNLPHHAGEGASLNDTLAPGESRLWGVQSAGRFAGHDLTIRISAEGDFNVSKTFAAPDRTGTEVELRDNVQTITVGVWTNGTIFYTNSAALLEDPDAPLGGHIDVDAALASALPLPVYVYVGSSADQPPSSRDNCYFTTIVGYNRLLGQSQTGISRLEYLAPEDAYTLPGNEAHFLYGDALIFLNVVVQVDGAAAVTDGPDPNGACFDAQNTVDYVSDQAPAI